GCHHRASYPQAGGENVGIVGLAFLAPVVAGVFAMAVLAILAVGFVVLVVVAYGVEQSEAVVRRQEVDRAPWPSVAMVEQVGRADQPRCELAALSGVAAPEPANIVAEAVVPLA